ncbi:MAG: hypothetical protein ABI977_22090 [Acidobacteriota bacterium]
MPKAKATTVLTTDAAATVPATEVVTDAVVEPEQQPDIVPEVGVPAEPEAPDTAPLTTAPPEGDADVKSAFMPNRASLKHVRVEGLRGGYGKAFFGNDGVTTEPVDEETALSIQSHFPGAQVRPAEAIEE